MLFNSIEFGIFLPIVFLLYWFVSKKIKIRNLILLLSSYVFYGWWDWRFLSLILFSSLLDYFIGRALYNSEAKNKRQVLLTLSILVNVGFLAVFKYYDFFAESLSSSFTMLGTPLEVNRLNVILPVGISFYTFQTLSYTIDIYKQKIEPTNNILAFLCFVGFFPQLVAGPIERAKNLLPQFLQKKKFIYSKATDGMRQILWGLFKKMVIADNCAKYVNLIFEDYANLSGSTLLMGLVLFSFQIYCDFSGYSDIAIGTARLFGFDFKQNFAYPYFSRNLIEFWRRWHISLSTWFRDYIYIPLGGSRIGTYHTVRNILIVFLISGFWHGANFTFIAWGLVHAILLIGNLGYLKLSNSQSEIISKNSKGFKNGILIISTYLITTIAWVFFRAETIEGAFLYLGRLFSSTIIHVPSFVTEEKLVLSALFIGVLIYMEWLSRNKKHALEDFGKSWPHFMRYGFYYSLAMVIFLFGSREQTFIYFQF